MQLINLYICLFSITFCNLFSQDIIIKTNGSEIKAKILEISATDIKYKKNDNLDGPTYTNIISEIKLIKFSNGTVENFDNTSNSSQGASNLNGTSENGIIINYEISYPSGKPIIKSQCYKNCITVLQKTKSLTKSFSEYDDIYSTITEDCFQTLLTSFPDQKILIKTEPKITLSSQQRRLIKTNETKTILGETCNKYIIESIINGVTIKNVYFMFPAPENFNYCIFNVLGPQAPGIMLGCELDCSNGVIQKWTAKSIYEEQIDPLLFKIPEDYQILTMDEFQNKLISDKNFSKTFKSAVQLTDEYKNKIKKETWNSIATMLLKIGTEVKNGLEENNVFPKLNNTLESSPINYTNSNTNSTSSNSPLTDAFNKNMIELNKFYNTQHPDKPIDIYANTVNYNNTANSAESAASTNGGSIGGTNSGANGNTGDSKEMAICGKQAEKLFENSQELKNMYANPNCSKMATIASRKRTEIYLNNCRSLLSKADIDGLTQGLAKMQAHINSMPDCQNIIYGK